LRLCERHALHGGGTPAAVAWERRGLSLADQVGPCRERGYLALARVGCEVADADELARRAELALQVARDFDDRDLQLRAMGGGTRDSSVTPNGVSPVCKGSKPGRLRGRVHASTA
jgi:hypothetical protein